ncbi:uncharacterized protein LOC142571118 [Dermacentor variabilis]|uniref:uncharacterized protein LOC142571118 n=1 Tax=Dermacentor variabilis TaxID=34621 RepID=UPI003F5ADF4B
MQKGNTNCCVVGCNSTYSNSPGTKFYRFPSRPYEAERRQSWITLVRRQRDDGSNWTPAAHSRICSKHFVGGTKSNEEGHPAYFPSIFPAAYKTSTGPVSSDRYARKRKRQEQKMEEALQIPSCDSQETGCGTSPEPHISDSPPHSDNLSASACNQSAEDVHRVDASTMTEGGSATFSMNFTFISELCDGNASSYISHKEVCSTGLGSSCSPGFSDKSTGLACKEPFFAGFRSLQHDENAFHAFTAIDFSLFALLLSILPPAPKKLNELSIEDKILLFLIKLKHGLPFSFLSVLFGIHKTTASRIFKGLLVNIHAATRKWLYWPSQAAVLATLPPCFKLHYPKCRVVIDCTELETEMPPGIEKQNMWYSDYKGRHTIKYLVGIAPNGLITFLSKGFGGRTSDGTLTVESGFLSLLEPGDVVLADKGFPGIKTGVGAQDATLVMPPFATSPQFTESEVDATYETASVRIHVERVIQRLKIYDITRRIPHELTGYADEILHVLAVLTNLKKPIFAKLQK